MTNDLVPVKGSSRPGIIRLIHLADVVLEPGGLTAMLTWRPFDASAFRVVRSLSKGGLRFNTIIDGGANKGPFTRAATETYPDAQIIAFEPLPDLAEALRRNLTDRPQVKVMESALGSREGTIDFSGRPQAARSGGSGAGTMHKGEVLEVSVCRLDNALQQILLRPPILLRLDLQGFEIEALRGGVEALSKMDYVIIETSFIPRHAGEPTFLDILEYLRSAGFSFIRPLDFVRDSSGSIVHMEALFAQSFAPAA